MSALMGKDRVLGTHGTQAPGTSSGQAGPQQHSLGTTGVAWGRTHEGLNPGSTFASYVTLTSLCLSFLL